MASIEFNYFFELKNKMSNKKFKVSVTCNFLLELSINLVNGSYYVPGYDQQSSCGKEALHLCRRHLLGLDSS